MTEEEMSDCFATLLGLNPEGWKSEPAAASLKGTGPAAGPPTCCRLPCVSCSCVAGALLGALRAAGPGRREPDGMRREEAIEQWSGLSRRASA